MSAVGDKMGPSERRLNDSQIPYRTLLSILTALFCIPSPYATAGLEMANQNVAFF